MNTNSGDDAASAADCLLSVTVRRSAANHWLKTCYEGSGCAQCNKIRDAVVAALTSEDVRPPQILE